MPEAVSSGPGRNGPWLQNAWLRVETRLDDASISPVALEGAFRPAERALASVDLIDAPPLAFGRAEYAFDAQEDQHGRGRRLTLTHRDARRAVVLRREVVMYDAQPYCVTRVGVTNESPAPLRIEALHAFTTPASGRGRLQLASRPADWRVYRNGWQSWSPTMSFGGAELDVQSSPTVLAPEPPRREPGTFASDDVGVLYDPASRRSLLAGAISARDLLTQVFVEVPARHIDARCLADGVALAPGDTLWSERIAVDLCGSPNEQLERYGDALGGEMGARVPASTPSGWCSWYYFYTGVTEDDVIRNLRFLESHRHELPVDTVQIDDGYQADIGDWLTVNEKFPRGMKWLASEIRAAGYTPGIWLAPFLLAESSKSYAAHPDWVVRDAAGAALVAQHNWQRDCYGIDGMHPGAQAWLADLFGEIGEGWGYDYLKIDFLFAAAIAGSRSDDAPRVRAYRQALAAVRRGAGDRRFILGCGSLMAPSVGFFDGNRIGPDVAPFWRFLTSEERATPKPRPRRPDDQLSAETAIRNTLTRSWMHNRLWASDPDCLLVRTDRTKLSLEETRTLASAIALSGGMLLASDDLDRLPPDRLDMLSMLLPPLPCAARPLDLLERDMPERFEAVVDREFDPLRLVALFNFDDEAKDLEHELPPGPWHAFDAWGERYLGVREGAVSFALVEPHGCRVVALRSAVDLPALVGTTAHIGCGGLDITYIEWSEPRLVMKASPAGRRARRLFVATMGRSVEGVRVDDKAAAFEAAAESCVIPLEVDLPATIEVTFAPRTQP
jgi:alpha-galactosidase